MRPPRSEVRLVRCAVGPAHRAVLGLAATAFAGVPVVVRETLARFALAEVEGNRIIAGLPGRLV
ncbi:MAG: hypothetical protein ABJC74_06355 [Gemmatimonadota bacterium]